jgi:hypothetical protein
MIDLHNKKVWGVEVIFEGSRRSSGTELLNLKLLARRCAQSKLIIYVEAVAQMMIGELCMSPSMILVDDVP